MNKFPWNCGECPMLHTYDLSIDDLTHICLWSKSQIDDCDRYKSAECPMEKHDEEIRADERAKVLDEVKNSIHTIYSQNLYCKEDMCENCTMGYDCEDCLATFLMGYIEDVMKSHKITI